MINDYKTFKSTVEGQEEAVFESGAVKHAAQFMTTLEKIAKSVQKKYNNDVAKMIEDVECPEFTFPECPIPQVVKNMMARRCRERLTRWTSMFGRRVINLFIV